MDIIASHQSGLVEQFEAEAVALAGRGRDGAQRAIAYHHVADLLGLTHGYALLAAHGALAIDSAVARMEQDARRSWWRLKRGERAALAERVAAFGETLRRLDAERCAGLLMAYRLVATPGLSGEAAKRFDHDLLVALGEACAARGQATGQARMKLFVAHQLWAETLFGERIAQAVTALEWPLAPRPLRAALDALLIPLIAFERADRRGLARLEGRLRASKRLPAAFAVNPAQAFFAAQRRVAKRRRCTADIDMLSPDEAVRLVA